MEMCFGIPVDILTSTSFTQLKCLLAGAPVLAYPDFKIDFILASIPDFL